MGRVMDAADPRAVQEALRLLRLGQVVAFPTDTVYGVGAVAFDARAVGRLYEIKGRSLEKAIPILLASGDDLARVALDPPAIALRLAELFWPGPLTIVLHKRPEVPPQVAPGPTVGVRVPDHPLAQALLQATGPLATTSANRSGEPSALDASQVVAALGEAVALVLDGGRAPGGRPSTVVDCTQDPPQLLREGPIALEEILRAARG